VIYTKNGDYLSAEYRVNIIRQVDTYTVTFNANDGNVSTESLTVAFGLPYGALPIPERAGYIFKGWYTAASGGTEVREDTTVTAEENHTLYAQWEAATLAGTVVITGEAKYGETLTAEVSDSNNTGSYSYQWNRDGLDIGGATADGYTLVHEDIGKIISCRVNSDVQSGYIVGSITNAVTKAYGPAVTGVSKTDCTTSENNDGKLIGVTHEMEYRPASNLSWIDGNSEDITGLLSGT